MPEPFIIFPICKTPYTFLYKIPSVAAAYIPHFQIEESLLPWYDIGWKYGGGGGGCGTDGTRYKSLNQGSSIHSLTQNTEYLLFTQTQERQGSQKGS